MIECLNCGVEYDPVRTRWLCPSCLTKEHCCEGAPQAPTRGT